MYLQSIRFDKAEWTERKAKNWLKRHNMSTELDNKEEYYRHNEKGKGTGVFVEDLIVGNGIKFRIERKKRTLQKFTKK